MANTILFVCKGNRYRSRIAEEIFNRHAPKGFVAESAGIQFQKWNDRATPKVLMEIGVRLTKRKPKRLTRRMLSKASKIIVFDGVKIASSADTWPVRDCRAGDIRCIRKGRNQIERRVKALIKSLERSA
ncbi:MAG: hypothetical protein HY517_04580 [Candidatus Aenigmarchaeota archaeon]|nr:hypothetical protein [Candidatus Aenigmarchaeota archaeon]